MPLAKIYRIETERLVIRCYDPKDAPMLLDAITESLNHLRPWMPWTKDEPTTVEEKVNLLRRFRGQFDLGEDYVFGIFNKSETEVLGSTGLHTRAGELAREIGYWIHINHINQGLASEAVRSLTKVGFEIEKLSRIEIHCSSDNLLSQRIPKKIGYKLQQPVDQKAGGVLNDRDAKMIWTMSKQEYEHTRTAQIQLQAFDILGKEIVC